MIGPNRHPLLLVVSAPSGAGKTTLCNRLLEESGGMAYSVSCTTRAPRGHESDGKHYHFLGETDFLQRVERGEFLEHARVHGALYGTLRQAVLEPIAAGKDVLMDIDVQGATQIREHVRRAPAGDPLKNCYVDIFIAPPSMEELESRLRGRAEDAADVIERRIEKAREEMAHWHEYMYLVVNDRIDDACVALCAIVAAEHHRVR